MTRAERRAQRKRIAKCRRPLAWKENVSDNELAIRHPRDCGSHCLLCHGEKFLRGGRRRQRLKREAEREIASW